MWNAEALAGKTREIFLQNEIVLVPILALLGPKFTCHSQHCDPFGSAIVALKLSFD